MSPVPEFEPPGCSLYMLTLYFLITLPLVQYLVIISKIRCSDKGNDDMKMKFLKEYAKRLTAWG